MLDEQKKKGIPMQLTKAETEILTKALANQAAEKREQPHWRAAVKCPVHSTTREIAGDEVNPWCDPEFSRNTDRPAQFMKQVQSIFGAEIVPGRTNTLTLEAWQQIGFVFAAGKVCWSRAEAEKQIKAWQETAPHLEYFVLPELESFADLFLAEIAGAVAGSSLTYRNRPMVVDPGADVKAVEAAFKKLESKGLACCVEGQDAARKWSGVNITKKGVEAISTATNSPSVKAEPEPDGPRLKCVACGGIFHSVTDKFSPGEKPRGDMFRLLPHYKSNGWEEWSAGWVGEALTCPGCGEPAVDPHTGLLREGALIEPKS
jgi:hypothetical protein